MMGEAVRCEASECGVDNRGQAGTVGQSESRGEVRVGCQLVVTPVCIHNPQHHRARVASSCGVLPHDLAPPPQLFTQHQHLSSPLGSQAFPPSPRALHWHYGSPTAQADNDFPAYPHAPPTTSYSQPVRCSYVS